MVALFATTVYFGSAGETTSPLQKAGLILVAILCGVGAYAVATRKSLPAPQ